MSCDECGFPECVCPCELCGDKGETADGALCACMRCPECGTPNPFEPKHLDCATCRAARGEIVREAERAFGWDASP